jgi:hypothetical protein
LDDSDWDADSEVGMDAGRSAEEIVDEVIDAMLERLEESDPVVEWVIDGLLDIVLPRGELAVRIRAKVSPGRLVFGWYSVQVKHAPQHVNRDHHMGKKAVGGWRDVLESQLFQCALAR